LIYNKFWVKWELSIYARSKQDLLYPDEHHLLPISFNQVADIETERPFRRCQPSQTLDDQ